MSKRSEKYKDIINGKENLKENITESLRFHYQIHGRVQGVGFRNWLENLSRELGFDGFCRNLSDGTVELVVKTPNEKMLNVVEQKLQKGPLAARVDRVEKTPWNEEISQGFQILATK